MLTQQPPIYNIGKFTLDVSADNLHWFLDRSGPVKQGLRMGELFHWFIGVGREVWEYCRLGIVAGGAKPLKRTDAIQRALEIQRPLDQQWSDAIEHTFDI